MANELQEERAYALSVNVSTRATRGTALARAAMVDTISRAAVDMYTAAATD
eukprot:CAMPEP_0183357068 /NCGR_PEP_ID=MMETSP0164_2-20130417/45360_1 /TAXON_ID=221442 /ORGANISM="Coccolithus pelagicus ssp braarudi, Strain PLY182g" /LENGTH=50 /DNA_ID=CAMNT_0025530617 /DNA_START=98 /DNA_END=248 /DNA_ORIENTATION=-